MIKRSPVRKVRRGPARRGRVVDKAFMAWMHANFGCLVDIRCHDRLTNIDMDCRGARTLHHIRDCGSPKNDRRSIMLCQAHHHIHWGHKSIEFLGKKRWQEFWGIDIESEITRYNALYEAEKPQ